MKKAVSTIQSRILFNDWLARMRDDPSSLYGAGLTLKTKFTYIFDIERHILPFFEGYFVDEINRGMIRRFIAQKMESGRLDQSGGLSASFVRALVSVISRAMEQACEEGMVEVNPCSRADLPEIPKKSVFLMNDWQYTKIKELVLQSDVEYAISILLIRDSGAYVGEVCGLRWGDFRYTESDLHFRRCAHRIYNPNAKTGSTAMICTDQSGVKNRISPIPMYLADILRQRQAEVSAGKSDWIFPQLDGGPRDPKSVQSLFWRMAGTLGLPSKNLGVLRDNYAIKALQGGMDLNDLKEILGIDNESKLRKRYAEYIESSSDARKRVTVERIFGL